MVESGNFIEENGGFLIEAYAEEKVRVYAGKGGLRLTEIDLNGKTIIIARDPKPAFFPKTYGEIIIHGESASSRLNITRFSLDGPPRFMISEGSKPIGYVVGNRLDLALAEGLGLRDRYLEGYARHTIVTPQIPEKNCPGGLSKLIIWYLRCLI